MCDTVASADGEMLVPAVGRNACKRGVIVSLCAGWLLAMAAWGTKTRAGSQFFSCLDDVGNECYDVGKLPHVDVKMMELISERLVRHDL